MLTGKEKILEKKIKHLVLFKDLELIAQKKKL